MKIVLLSLVILVTSCSRFTEARPHPKGKPQGLGSEPGNNPSPGNPGTPGTTPTTPGGTSPGGSEPNPSGGEVAQTAPINAYLSIGTYLQKELDKTDNAGKIVKVYAQIRQENNIDKNFESLKGALAAASQNLAAAADEAKKLKQSTVEFEVEIKALKDSLGTINTPVSSLEISGSVTTVKQ